MLIFYCIFALALAAVICLIAGRDRPWIAQAAYAAVLMASLVTASKISPIIDGVFVSAAVGLYSMSFLLTDFLSEVHGKRAAKRAVMIAVVSSVLFVSAIYFSVALPAAPFWTNQEAFQAVLGSAPRVLAASLTAFVLAQLVDIQVFHIIRKLTGDRWLFLRNNLSTWAGQAVDTVAFYTIAFYGVIPNIIELIAITFVVKVLIALVDTPVFYFVRARVFAGSESEVHHEPMGER